MWRSRLYADCRIMLVSADGQQPPQMDDDEAEDEAVFSAHRAILCSRSPYFASLLLDPYADSQKRIFSLPSPPFTPASLHFSLGYLYCGTLEFSNRTFDLATAMQIWRSAQYLGLDHLREEAEVRIMRMCHSFRDVCKSCVGRIGRVYAFSVAPDVQSKRLQEATRKPTVDAFGEVWCKEIGELDYDRQTKLVELICTGIDPNTTVDVIRNSKRLKERIASERSQWADHLLSMLEPIDARVATVLRKKFPAVVTSKAFQDLLEGVGFSNDVLERLLNILTETLSEETAAETYQVLVGQVLLRDQGIPMDARARVEDARAAILKYLKTKWVAVKSYNGFEPLDNWALKELSDGTSSTSPLASGWGTEGSTRTRGTGRRPSALPSTVDATHPLRSASLPCQSRQARRRRTRRHGFLASRLGIEPKRCPPISVAWASWLCRHFYDGFDYSEQSHEWGWLGETIASRVDHEPDFDQGQGHHSEADRYEADAGKRPCRNDRCGGRPRDDRVSRANGARSRPIFTSEADACASAAAAWLRRDICSSEEVTDDLNCIALHEDVDVKCAHGHHAPRVDEQGWIDSVGALDSTGCQTKSRSLDRLCYIAYSASSCRDGSVDGLSQLESARVVDTAGQEGSDHG